MKVKVSDYIAEYFVSHNITTVFTVVGGGAMHLNHSFSHNERLKCIYNHHEQASGMAAESYYRVNNKMAAVCVTSGPGAINALNGVVGAYQDSIPMIVISGQVKSSLTVKSSGLSLRTLGGQEFDIVSALDNVCKYAEMIVKPSDIKRCLDRAFHVATSGRPGPCWLDIPVDVQGAFIDTDELVSDEYIDIDRNIDESLIDIVIDKISTAKRPVLYAGNGIRIAGAATEFERLVEALKIPVVTCWDSIDLIDTDNPYYVGRAGTMGDRPGNFAVQNSDLLICIGTRLNIYQVGYNVNTWARAAYVMAVDIDGEELKKPTIRVDMPICADAKDFITALLESNIVSFEDEKWIDICQNWKLKYPVVSDKQRSQQDLVNIYGFIDCFSRMIGDDSITVVANGSASVVGSAAYYIGKNSRFIMNCALSSMGYDLPAAIGVAVSVLEDARKDIFCIAGDGSIMMNLQELQTIVTNNLPVKIVIINNNGYHQIRQTQTNLFNKEYCGMGPESGDLGFPDFSKLSYAFGYHYQSLHSMADMKEEIDAFIKQDGYSILEVFCDTNQIFEPKSATRRLEDGSLYSPPLEDLAPFLSKEELEKNMYI